MVQVAGHHVRPTHLQLARLVLPGDAKLVSLQRAPYRGVAPLRRVVVTAARRGADLGHPEHVEDGRVRRVELLEHRGRAGRAGHKAGAHRLEAARSGDQQAPEQSGRTMHDSCSLRLHGLQQRVEGEAGLHERGRAARGNGGEQAAESERVGGRDHKSRRVLGRELQHVRERASAGDGARMCHERALRSARASRGVEHGGDLRRELGGSIARRHVVAPLGDLARGVDDEAATHGGELGKQRGDHVGEAVGGMCPDRDDGRRPSIGKHPLQLVLAQAGVQRHRHGARAPRGKQRHGQGGNVRGHNRDAVAGNHQPAQLARQAVDALAQRGVVELVLAMGQGEALGVLLRGRAQQGVDALMHRDAAPARC